MQEKYISKEKLGIAMSSLYDMESKKELLNSLKQDGYTIEGYNEPKSTFTAEKKLVSDTGASIKNRAGELITEVKDTFTKPIAEQKNPLSKVVSVLGSVGGAIGDAISNVDKYISGGKIGETAEELAKDVTNVIPEDYKNDISNTFKSLAEKYPERAEDLNNVLEASNLLVFTNPARKAIGDVTKGVVETPKVFGGALQEVNKKSKDIISPSTNKYIDDILKDSTMPSNKVYKFKSNIENALGLYKTTPIEIQDAKTGKIKPFSFEKANVPEIIQSANELSNKTSEIHINSLKKIEELDPSAKLTNLSDVYAFLTEKVNAGEASMALKNTIIKQLKSKNGSLVGINDWITKANQYFGSQANTRIVASEVADILRNKLDDVIDRKGYANTFGNVRDLKRLIVSVVSKNNPSIAEKISGKPLDIAFDLIAKNPVGIVMKGSGILKSIFTSTDFEKLKKAGVKAPATYIKGGDIKTKPMLQLPAPEQKMPQKSNYIPINLPKSIIENNLGVDEVKKARAGGKVKIKSSLPNKYGLKPIELKYPKSTIELGNFNQKQLFERLNNKFDKIIKDNLNIEEVKRISNLFEKYKSNPSYKNLDKIKKSIEKISGKPL